VQKQEIEWDSEIDAPLPVPTVTPHLPRVERALDLLLAAERPLILAGGGVVLGEASEKLRLLAEQLDIPVQVTLMGKGSFREDHELFAGITGIQTQQRWANATFLESDTVLALGARFGDRHTGDLSVYRGDRTFIHVDIEPTQIGKVFGPDLGIVSDTGAFLDAMLELAKARSVLARPDWTARVRELKATLGRREDFDTVPIKAPRVFKEINEAFSEQTYFVTAIGLYQIWSGQFQRAFLPRHYQVCGQAGPLGWEIPAAIGVKSARPEAEVVAVVGDYSFQFLVEELAVAAQYNTPFVIIMINNEYLGLIRQAETAYGMNYQVDIHYDENGTDNVKVMEAYGCAGRRVTQPGEIASTIEWARKETERIGRPVLVEIMVDREANASMGAAINAINEFEPLPEPDLTPAR